MNVSEYLSVGKDRAVPAADLCKRIGIDRRALFAEVRRERLEGVPILPDFKGGYYIADLTTAAGVMELRAFERRMHSMGRSTAGALAEVRKAAGNGTK